MLAESNSHIPDPGHMNIQSMSRATAQISKEVADVDALEKSTVFAASTTHGGVPSARVDDLVELGEDDMARRSADTTSFFSTY